MLAPEGGLPLVACRALSLACLLGVFGTLAFRHWVARGIGSVDAAQRRCLIGFAAAGLGLLALWTVWQSANFAGTTPLAALAVVPQVLGQTAFGKTIAGQEIGLVLILGLATWAWRPAGRALACGLAAAVLLLHIRHSHAGAEHSVWLAGSEALHLLAAGAWLGSFLPLMLALRRAPLADAALLLRRYQGYGALCVLGLIVSAPIQYATLIGGLPALVGTFYGRLGLLKLVLFLVLLGFAVANRARLGPALERAGPQAARHRLLWSVGVEALVGLALVCAAATMAQSAPGMHQQPIWPFAKRFSLVSVSADPDFAQEVLLGAIEFVAGLCLLGLAAVARHWLRYVALAAAIAMPFLAAPHLSLLFVPANPDSFFHSTSGFTDASIVQGAALYPASCAACHGAGGHGDGPAAATGPVPPADLTAPHLWEHSDGDLFWWLTHGMVAPDGRPAMPGFAATLSDDDRWALIDFIRARNAGDTVHAGALWSSWGVPMAAPDIALDCGSGPGQMLADFRGAFLLLTFGPKAPQPAPPNLARTLWVDPHARAVQGVCAATDPAALAAYAIATGQAHLAGVSVVVDRTGQLRALRQGGFSHAALATLRAAPAPAAVTMAGMRM